MNPRPIWACIRITPDHRLEVLAERQTLAEAREAAASAGGVVVLRPEPPRPERQSRRRHYAHDDDF